MRRNPKNKKKKRAATSSSKRNNFKDSTSADEDELVHDEITALLSIFDEGEIVCEKPLQINIRLRPYGEDEDSMAEKHDISAMLSVRIVQGYPSKVPKLQITEEEGLSSIDVNNLLSILHEQANINARDGRVMIFNIVEAAREFLTEFKAEIILPKSTNSAIESCHNLVHESITNTEGPFVYGLIDLFGGFASTVSSSYNIKSEVLNVKTYVKKAEMMTMPLPLQEGKVNPSKSIVAWPKSCSKDLVKVNFQSENSETHMKDSGSEEYESQDDNIDHTHSDASNSSTSFSFDKEPEYNEIDLMMVHFLRLICASKGSLSDSISHISTELCNLGIVSENIQDLVCKPSSEFLKISDKTFGRHMASSSVSEFWNSLCNVEELETNFPSSRYLEDFEELQTLGHGGFGHVSLCKNKLDGRQYAVKKIRIKEKTVHDNDRILREVATLARLQHQHVVRYYQAWWETGMYSSLEDSFSSFDSKSCRTTSTKIAEENGAESTYLYIQMEYCPRTLRKILDSNYSFDMELAWHWFRQIVEGLAHIHGQGIIHRDLTPNNIFFDSRNDVKIGDFGLAKFLQFEHLDHDTYLANEISGVSIDGSNVVGTFFYTAPEIEQGWPKIDQKADMYSLGIVFFELWHPFTTAMERNIILSNLKKGEVSSLWMVKFPEQLSLLKRLLSPVPSDRPSATDLLKNDFPPRMEYDLLESMLKTMHASDDRTVYEKVVGAVFDDESLALKVHQQDSGTLRVTKNDRSSTKHTETLDNVYEVAREIFNLHGAKHVKVTKMHLIDDSAQPFRQNAVMLLTQGGDIIELSHELRHQFATWVAACQKFSFRRYEISSVYRRAIGRSPPCSYLQGDFDIVGGSTSLTEAEAIKVTTDIVNNIFPTYTCDIHLNHGHLIEAIWSWVGIKPEHRQKVSELLLIIQSWRPQSPERKSKWAVVRRQLLQELNLEEAVINRLNTAVSRFCGSVDKALPRLRGALTINNSTRKALDELSDLHRYLEIWKVQNSVYVDPTMLPTEYYHRDLYFQVYLVKNNEKILLASGGRYDHLLREKWSHLHSPKSSASAAAVGVGASIGLAVVAEQCSGEVKAWKGEGNWNVLVCSKGGGGLLEARMELVAELWKNRLSAEYVPKDDPSLMEQYDYAGAHGIKWLVIVTECGVSQTGFVKVRHVDVKKEKEVKRELLVNFLFNAFSHFRNPSLWI